MTMFYRRDAGMPFQRWMPFLPDDYVEVWNAENERRVGYAKDFWWGYELEQGSIGEGVIVKARKIAVPVPQEEGGMSGIIERLSATSAQRLASEPIDDRKNFMHVYAKISRADGALMREAADLLEEAVKALEPFAPPELAGFEQALWGEYDNEQPASLTVKLGDIRAARATRTKIKGE